MYLYVNFPFLLLGYFECRHLSPCPEAISRFLADSQSLNTEQQLQLLPLCLCPSPSLCRQAGKEPEATRQPTLLENQISDKKALSLGTNMKISLFG